MESTGELEAVTMCGEIDIKEEPVLTDPNWQLFEETEHIFIKEENVKLETPEDPDAHDPLQLKKEESPPQEETISPPDAIHTKKEPELQKEVEATSCGIEPRSLLHMEDPLVFGAVALAVTVNLRIRAEWRRKRKARRCWVRPWLERRDEGRGIYSLLMKELRPEDPQEFQNFIRMDMACFEKLLSLIENGIRKCDTVMREAITPSRKLVVTLRFLATGESFKSLAFSHRIAQPTISKVVVDVCTAICNTLKDQYLKAPATEEEWEKIAKEFDELWQFPNCIGAMDGKHIAFAQPRTAGSAYFSYKKFHSIVLLAIVDARYRFSLIDIGCNARVCDGGVYASSLISNALQENWLKIPQQKSLPGTNIEVPCVVLADDAFHLKPHIMKPYRDCQHQKPKQIFNYRLSRGRRVVENAFGILANRFRVLLSTIRLPVQKVELIVQTLCILHNYLIEEADSTYLSDADTENTDLCTINNGSWRAEESLSSISRQSGNHTSLCAREVREKFCEFFSSSGYVSWQWEAVKKYNF
ncbi:uncharacterized protein LOC126106842 [Schistocerca cancellata]|uniref:uncharacterized protein LOC126106842 n=1 Tax=Schistocerca cancellata TaxID=274614 RepID=UPI002117AF1D|nr:uncharacterized protein LOC126106842 [Schistocerca cancellata]